MDFSINDIINTVSFLTFIGLSMAIFARISHRLLLFRDAHEKIPILLKRDFALFAGLAVFLFFILAFRLFASDQDTLRNSAFWLLFSNAVIQAPLAYWAYVEWTQ